MRIHALVAWPAERALDDPASEFVRLATVLSSFSSPIRRVRAD
jgi:hypothetical protein